MSLPPNPREGLRKLKMRRRREMQSSSAGCSTAVDDPYKNAQLMKYMTRKSTAVSYEDHMLKHFSPWDPNHPESPHRITSILECCHSYGVLERCLYVENVPRNDLLNCIELIHGPGHYSKLEEISAMRNIQQQEDECSNYDSIFINENTFSCACRALSTVINIIDKIVQGEVDNGMAIIRPPGHHALYTEFNGYCFFNNVAIAAEYLIQNQMAKKVLIVDIDVHHGQGIQRAFYNRNDILYFSIHRYEHGQFWPNLFESNFNFIGEGDGLGFNVNVPLNATGLTDDDYLAIVFNVLLPLGYEFSPDFILIAAGYDAAIGCPEGCMRVTPGFYAHLITLLSGLAKNRILACLEGGYFCPSLAEGVALTIKGLLGDPCPLLNPVRSVHPSVIQTISDVRRTLGYRWRCFEITEIAIDPFTASGPEDLDQDVKHYYMFEFHGTPGIPPFLTRDCYFVNSTRDDEFNKRLVDALKVVYAGLEKKPVGYVYDDRMLRHRPRDGEAERPERPERLSTIYEMFREYGLFYRLNHIPFEERESFGRDYSSVYINLVTDAANIDPVADLFANEHTQESVTVATSALLGLCDAVMTGQIGSGIALIRPPGHHADCQSAMGFCFINNIAVAAEYLLTKYSVRRVLIVDFDVHHGNGTQNTFYGHSNVMYISIHRDDDGTFYPKGSARSVHFDGYGPGRGYNINIPLNGRRLGDSEYLSVFHNLVLPIAYSYAPEVVLVSAGFDAGVMDTLGCYNVSPEIFGHFIQMLKPLAEGRLILALEGGYNVRTTSFSTAICAKALLGDPLVLPSNLYTSFNSSAIQSIIHAVKHFQHFYPILNVNQKVSAVPVLVKRVETFYNETYCEPIYVALENSRTEDSSYIEAALASFNLGE